MNERDDQSIDHELSGVAMAATHEHELTVSSNETEAALEAVRSRLAGGDLGGAPPSISLASSTPRRRHSPLARLGAVAAAVAMVALGLVAVVGGGPSNDVVAPATLPATPGPNTDPPSTAMTTVPETEAAATSSTPTVAAESTFERQVVGVDALDPPRLVEPVPYFSLPLEPNEDGNRIEFAVGADHVVVNQPDSGTITIVGPDVGGISARVVAVDEDISSIVSGPGPVIYGFGEPAFDDENQAVPRGFRFVAIPFLGDNEGKVVAVDEVGLNEYLEIPPYFFGHGPGGVISRGRDRATVIGYVSEDGQPLVDVAGGDFGVTFPTYGSGVSEVDASFVDDDIIELAGTDVSWQLDIARDPLWESTYVGRNVVAPGDTRAIYAERIGADTTPDAEFGVNSMPVVALLNYDGSGEWVRLPEDWDVVASDVWGTLLARVADESVELAWLDDLVPPVGPGAPTLVDSSPVDSTPLTTAVDAPTTTLSTAEPNGLVQPTAIVRTCLGEFIGCTDLANTETGRIVGFDQADEMFRVYDAAGTELQAEVPIGEPLESPSLWHVGPDDVAYIQTYPADAGDGAAELLAIPLVGSNAGSVVMRWSVDGTGDSTLIPRKTGLTVVGCCGRKVTRPSPDASIFRWVDRNGEIVESVAPSFDLNLGEGNSLTRIDTQPDGSAAFTRFTLPTALQYPRDFPWVVATDDGGALAYEFVNGGSGAGYVMVDFDVDWPGVSVDNGDVYYRPSPEFFERPLLERSGSVVVWEGANDGQYARRNLDEIASPGWPGQVEVDLGTASSTAPGLNDYIDAQQPFWATDPELFALQLSPSTSDSATTLIEDDGSDAPVITITTTGLLDDSADSTQLVVTTDRADDGLLRFVSATYGFRCVPGRGHQDFSTELCI